MEHIVIGVGDSASRMAVDWVIRRARRHPTRIHLVRAFDSLMEDRMDGLRLLADESKRILASVPDAEVTTALVMSAVPDALGNAALGADLVVIGAHRDHPVRSTLRGAVPLRVAASVRCATVIVPMDWRVGTGQEIVAGLDDDGTSDEAVLFAAREAVATHSTLTVVHVWSIPGTAGDDVLLLPEDVVIREHHDEVLAETLDRIRAAEPAAVVQGALEQRQVATALADHATRAELIVIGSHRRGPISGLVWGSTARGLLTRTATAICIVPPLDPIPEDLELLELADRS